MDVLAHMWLSLHPEYLPYFTAAISIASGIAMILPPPTETGWRANTAYAGLYRAVHWVSLSFGHAVAASDPKAIQAARDTLNNAPPANAG